MKMCKEKGVLNEENEKVSGEEDEEKGLVKS